MRAALLSRLCIGRYRVGMVLTAAFIVVAAILWLALIPGLSRRIDCETRAVARARATPSVKPPESPQKLAAETLAAFYSTLGDGGREDEIVGNLFKAATAAGIALDKGEYKPAHDAAGRFDTYSIVLPVKGNYASIRHFCENVLLTTPYAALDDIRFERASASDPAVKANLRFTMFTRPDATSRQQFAAREVQQ